MMRARRSRTSQEPLLLVQVHAKPVLLPTTSPPDHTHTLDSGASSLICSTENNDIFFSAG
jgi:hypothetical protein